MEQIKMPYAGPTSLTYILSRPNPDLYYYTPVEEHITGSGATDEFYSYKDRAWVARSTLPPDAILVYMPVCHEATGTVCHKDREACEKNVELLRAELEADQPTYLEEGITLDEVKALIATAISAHSTDATAHVAAITPLITTAVSTHNTDPAAHPDIREAITSGGGGSGGGDPTVDPPSAPVITMADRLPIGGVASIGLSAAPAATASIAKFSVAINNGAAVDVPATDNSATYPHTPAGTAGDILTVKATATDNLGSVSTESTATATLYDPAMPIYWARHNNAQSIHELYRSDNNGQSFTALTNAPAPTISNQGNYGVAVSTSRDKVYVATIDESSGTKQLKIYRSTDLGATWSLILTPAGAYSLNAIEYAQGVLLVSYIRTPPAGQAINATMVSTDDGDTWQSSTASLGFLSVISGKPGDLWAKCVYPSTSNLYIYWSHNKGIDWGQPASPKIPGVPQSVCVLSDGRALVPNDAKNLYLLADGATSWSSTTLTWVARHIIPSGDTTNTILMSGSVANGTATAPTVVYKSTTGTSWTVVKALGIGTICGLYNFGEGIIIAGGDAGKLSRSLDYGKTWTTVSTGFAEPMTLI